VSSAPARPGLLLSALCFSGMVVAALQTLVVPILGGIGSALSVSAAAVSWVVTANLLAAAVMTPLLGRVGDLRGKRPVLVACMASMLTGSVLAATTSSLGLLVASRVLQGAAGGVFPLALSVLRDEVPPERLTSGMAVVSGTLGIGGGAGLVLTGLLTRDGGDYHRVFWLAAGLSAVALVLVLVAVPRRCPVAAGGIDLAGAAVLGVGLVLLLLPLSQGNVWGWGSPRTVGLLAGAAVALVAFVLVEQRRTDPLVQVSMLTSRSVLFTNLAGLLVGVAMFVSFLALSSFAQSPRAVTGYGFDASVLRASCQFLLPGALLSVVLSPLGGRLVRRVGGRVVLALGALLGLIAFALAVVAHERPWQLVVVGVVVQAGVSLAYCAMPALIVDAVDRSETGVANGINAIARSVGSSLASAVVVTLLTARLLPGGQPREDGYVIAFGVGAAACAVALLLVLVGLPRHQPRTTGYEPDYASLEAASAPEVVA
jgi:MFS family permease